MRFVRSTARTQVLDLPYQRALRDMPDIETTLAAWAQGAIAQGEGPWQEFAHCHGPLLVRHGVLGGYRSTPCDVVESALPQAEWVGEAAAVTGAAIAVAIAVTVTVTVTVLAIAILVVLLILAVAVGIGAGRTVHRRLPPDRASRPHPWSCHRARWSASPCLPKPRHARSRAASSCCSPRCR